MISYIGRRLLQVLPTVIAVTFASFMLIHLVPGNPGRIELGPRASTSAVAALNRAEGLYGPLLNQYLHFLRLALELNFGNSVVYHEPVAMLLASRLPLTFFLVAFALVIAVVLALCFGLISGMRENKVSDHLIRGGGLVTYVMPSFWVGIILILALSVHFRIFPTSGYGSGFLGVLRSLALPAITLALSIAPLFVRNLRASLIDNLHSGFVEAARSRGYSEQRIVWRHVLGNSLISMITLVGLSIGYLISTTVVVESVFNLPGIGALLVGSISSRDFPVVSALTMVIALIVILANLLTDVVYAVVDPRVRL